MPWVNKDGYSPGKRHYAAAVTRFEGEVKTREGVGTYHHFKDQAYGYLCGNGTSSASGYIFFNERGKRGHKYGGLSVVEQVNLNQRNLCSYCVKKFVNEVRPDLLPAYNAMKTGVVT